MKTLKQIEQVYIEHVYIEQVYTEQVYIEQVYTEQVYIEQVYIIRSIWLIPDSSQQTSTYSFDHSKSYQQLDVSLLLYLECLSHKCLLLINQQKVRYIISF